MCWYTEGLPTLALSTAKTRTQQQTRLAMGTTITSCCVDLHQIVIFRSCPMSGGIWSSVEPAKHAHIQGPSFRCRPQLFGASLMLRVLFLIRLPWCGVRHSKMWTQPVWCTLKGTHKSPILSHIVRPVQEEAWRHHHNCPHNGTYKVWVALHTIH